MNPLCKAYQYLVSQGMMQPGDVHHTTCSQEHITINVNHHEYIFNLKGVLVATDEE